MLQHIIKLHTYQQQIFVLQWFTADMDKGMKCESSWQEDKARWPGKWRKRWKQKEGER